jgi:anthranilate/para-aminobenzoate synthase component II
VILLIDNYDSFTYNLAQYLGELGAPPIVRRNDEVSIEEIERMQPQRIVISPGPGRPEDAGVTVETIRKLGPRIPLLGVCLGHQGIGLAFGGNVVRAGELMASRSRSPPAGITRSSSPSRCRISSRSPRARTTEPSWVCGIGRRRFTACSSILNRC